jgi:hypothetical protein
VVAKLRSIVEDHFDRDGQHEVALAAQINGVAISHLLRVFILGLPPLDGLESTLSTE